MRKYVTLGDVCKKGSSNIAQKDIENINGTYAIYGASGYIKDVNFYHQDKPYIAVVKDGAGIGRTMLLPEKTSVIGTLQYLIPNDSVSVKYLYYAITYMNLSKYFTGATIPHIYFKDYQKELLPLPPMEKQQEIAETLEKVDTMIELCNTIMEKMDVLVKSRFVEMFGDPTDNPMGWDKFPLGKRCNIITGNTPPRANAENYGTFIEWIKSDNINTPDTYLTVAEEYLSEKGFEKCRYVEAGSVLMTCIAGSIGCIGNVAVADRRVAFNQQINAIVPVNDETLYVFWLMQLSKPYIQSTINMALKGILSKGQLSVLEFPFPPMLEQTDFAAFVQEIDKSKLVCSHMVLYIEILLRKERIL